MRALIVAALLASAGCGGCRQRGDARVVHLSETVCVMQVYQAEDWDKIVLVPCSTEGMK